MASDFGAKGSTKGYNVQDVADYLQLFNSSWPLLKIDLSGNFSGTVTHDLGYPPFHFMATSTGQVDQNAGNYAVDSTTLARAYGVGTPRYYICRLDLTNPFTAETIPGTTRTVNISDDYGFKVMKPGKDITSADLRDYTLDSSARSLMVQQVSHETMVNTGGGLGYETTVSFDTGYTPIAFVFIRPNTNFLSLDPDKYGIVPPPVGAAGYYYEVSGSSVYVTADTALFTGNAPKISAVILKDPLTKEIINVSYP
jgi:hypothetical protein